ncbi:MAG: helix-turn-helix domain-containing protein [Lachnospiraceae bacterium]|nr:helix-turn-helix domain-containing protein [Lachnospiraceae bacterium]
MRGNKIAYTIEEAADVSGIGRNTIRQLVDWEKLPVLRVGRKILIRSDSLDKFIGLNEGRDLLNRDEVKAVTINVSA